MNFNAVKVFSATLQRERDTLGDKVTAWMETAPIQRIDDVRVLQSSDSEFHCVTFVVFYTRASSGAKHG